MKEWIVEVEAAHQIGLQQVLSDFSWPVPQSRYDEISRDVLRLLQREYQGVENDGELRTALSIAAADLASEYNYLLACLVDVTYARQSGVRLVYSDGCVLYPMLDRNRFYQRFSGLEKSQAYYRINGARAFKRKLSGQLHDLRFKFRAAAAAPNDYFFSANRLLQQWKSDDAFSIQRLHSDFRRSQISRSSLPSPVTEFSDNLASGVSGVLSEHSCHVTEEAEGYLRQLTRFYLGSAWAHLSYSYPSFVRFQNGRLLAGTGGNAASRAISHRFQRHSRPVFRFSHGGDRGLFDDWTWGLVELSFTDVYVAHGKGEGDRMRERLEAGQHPLMLSTRPTIVAIGSGFHEEIYNANQARQPAKRPKRVTLATAALNGESRHLPFIKVHDLVYLDWHVGLIKGLKEAGYHVTAKRHPKGILSNEPLLGPECEDEVIGGQFSDMLDRADAFVLDIAGSVFAEALCTMKPVVLIDLGNRPFNPTARRDLEKCCQIVPARIQEDNRIVIDISSVVDAIETPVDADARRAFVEEYLLRPSANLEDVMESVAAS